MTHLCCVLAIATIGAATGCSVETPTAAPKTSEELTEQEKQQIRDLNEQRAQEWGMKVKKK
jgi:hypothetical protein